MNKQQFRSRKDLSKALAEKGIDNAGWSEEKWLKLNKGQAEIHMMALAEAMWDAIMNESTPKQLKAGEWHIPFGNKINHNDVYDIPDSVASPEEIIIDIKVKIATVMCARVSYTVVGDEKEVSYADLIRIYETRLLPQPGQPFHASPFEHCARAMTKDERMAYTHTAPVDDETNDIKNVSLGRCRNFRGFIQNRVIIENQ